MDKVSALLAEARPLYRQRRKRRQFAAGAVCSLCCGVWFMVTALMPAYNPAPFETYYAALYESDGYFDYNVAADEILPLDGYGFYEVV